jgi:Spy/CpxP family protein refolding chaperone
MRFVHLMKIVGRVLVVGWVGMMGVTLSASEGQRGGRGVPPERLPLRELDLSNLQRQQIQELREQNGEAIRRAHENVKKSRRELNDAIVSAVVNEGVIRALAVDLGLYEGNAAVQRAYLYAQTWDLLTADQQLRVADIQAERRAEREDFKLWMKQRREGRRRNR